MIETTLDINHLELLSARAWPAISEVRFDGWIVRSDLGITWRANSVIPCNELKEHSLEDAIDEVIAHYRERGHSPAFKITESSAPPNLDSALDSKGFSKQMVTHFQTIEIEECPDFEDYYIVEINESPDANWITAYSTLGNFDSHTLDVRLGIINRIDLKRGFAEIRAGGEIIGIGMGVLDGQYLGLFGIITSEKHRRKGVGLSLSCALLEWGKKDGATIAYLQVEARNTSAISLYSKIGFATLYDYWYRILR